ncbi:hypothetical protein L9F63_018947, partial [Diploptera punctata]
RNLNYFLFFALLTILLSVFLHRMLIGQLYNSMVVGRERLNLVERHKGIRLLNFKSFYTYMRQNIGICRDKRALGCFHLKFLIPDYVTVVYDSGLWSITGISSRRFSLNSGGHLQCRVYDKFNGQTRTIKDFRLFYVT